MHVRRRIARGAGRTHTQSLEDNVAETTRVTNKIIYIEWVTGVEEIK